MYEEREKQLHMESVKKPERGISNPFSPPKKQSEEDIARALAESIEELDIVMRLKQALLDYLGIYDYFVEESSSAMCMLLGQLELSIAQRKQMLVDEPQYNNNSEKVRKDSHDR